jgi:hypothetical protein
LTGQSIRVNGSESLLISLFTINDIGRWIGKAVEAVEETVDQLRRQSE